MAISVLIKVASFKHVYFDHTIKFCGDSTREVIIYLSVEKADLSYSTTGVVGSLGFTTLIEHKLCKARKFVEMIYYYPMSSMA